MASAQCVSTPQCNVVYSVKVDAQISSDTVLGSPDKKSYLALNPTTCLFEVLSSVPSYGAKPGLFYTLTSTAGQVVLTRPTPTPTTILTFGSCLASNPGYVLTLANGGVPTICLGTAVVASLSQLLVGLLTSAARNEKVVPSQTVLAVPSGASLVSLNPASSQQLSVLPYVPSSPNSAPGTYYELTPSGQVKYYVNGTLKNTFGNPQSAGNYALKLALNAASVPEVKVTSGDQVLQEVHVGIKLVYKITEGAKVYSDTALATASNTLFLILNPAAPNPGSAFGLVTSFPTDFSFSDKASYLLNTVGQIELTIKIGLISHTVKFGAVLATATNYSIQLLSKAVVPTVGVYLGNKQVATIDLTKPIPVC